MIRQFLFQNPKVHTWLGGVEPAWLILDEASFVALQGPGSPTSGPIRLAPSLSSEDLQRSAVARNALILIQAATVGPGLKMTVTGNLTRDVVAAMIDRFTWPGFDKEYDFRLHKVINEPDFLPLLFVRHVVETGKLLRRQKRHLKVTRAGRKMLEEQNQGGLQAILFRLALWRLDLGYLGRGLHHGWPQCDIGIVLWSLSVAANDWQPSDRLTRLCTIPIDAALETAWDSASYAMEATILRPLLWFGLLECREDDKGQERWNRKRLYRKSPMYDRFLSFDVELEVAAGSHH